MLETKMNKLDFEFMKLWSEYLLNDDANEIMTRLKELALKGQMNAIQKWYGFNAIGQCKEIDNIVENLKGITTDELLAIARYNHADKNQVETANNLITELRSLIKSCNENFRVVSVGKFLATAQGDNTHFLNRIKQIKNVEIPNKAPCLDYYLKALEKAETLYDRTLNVYVLTKIVEIAKAIEGLPLIPDNYLYKQEKRLLKTITKQYKEKVKQGITSKDDPQFYYHFAKAIIMCGGKMEHRQQISKILADLSETDTTNKNNDTEINKN